MVNIHHAMRTRLQELFSIRDAPRIATKKQADSPNNDASSPTPVPGATDGADDFASILAQETTSPAASNTAPPASQSDIRTVESMLGSDPFMKDPGGVGPTGSYSYNPMQFATRATADKLAQMYGGTVVETDAMTPYGPYHQNQPNELIQFPNGTVLNAGLMVSYFNRGYTQSQVDQFV